MGFNKETDTLIYIKKSTKEKLVEIKYKYGFKSYDKVINELYDFWDDVDLITGVKK